jgi:DNA-directed RNA polymerase III subunit RPC2
MARNLGVEDLHLLNGEELSAPDTNIVLLNGNILGVTRRPTEFIEQFRLLRRRGFMGEHISIFHNRNQRCVYLASDAGRVCRPYIIVENGKPRLQAHHLRELSLNLRTFDGCIRDGCGLAFLGVVFYLQCVP